VIRAVAVLLAVLSLAAAAARADGEPAADLRVRMRPSAAAAGGFVRLDEVAELSGPRAAEAAGVLLGRAPDAGRSRAISARSVGQRLEEEGFDARRVELSGAVETVVGTAAHGEAPAAVASSRAGGAKTAAGSDDILRELAAGWIRSALAARLKCAAEELDVRVDSARAAGTAGELREARAEVQWSGSQVRLGRQSAVITLSDGGKQAGRVQVGFDAGVFRTVPVAARDLPAGRLLAAEDVASARVRLTDLSAELPSEAGLLSGVVTSRALRAGAPFDARTLVRQTVVRRGQPVTLVCESGAVRISETAIACADGALGDLVTVERAGGARKQQLAGRVAGPGLVKME